jgi:manganese/zinc/iron transport system permease protein
VIARLLILLSALSSSDLLLPSRSAGWISSGSDCSSASFALVKKRIADLPTEQQANGRGPDRAAWSSLCCIRIFATGSLTDRSIKWPGWPQWKRVLLLHDYNTRIVILGTMLLGIAAGTIGSFTLLRRRALMGDALSHATLPGVGLAFLIAPWLGLDGKSLPVLLSGAALSGIAGVAAILYVRNLTRLKEDAALGIVLSVFFGAGIAILTIIQQLPTGHAAGLESFIYGKTASMIASDASLIAWSGLFCVLVISLLFKELTLLCFDEGFAGSRGYPLLLLDLLLMALVVIVTIVGLQAVGLVLMIALLVIPAAAARFWTQNLKRMTWISAGIGGVGGLIGSAMSAVFPNLPSGAMIVLVCSALFFHSMLSGTERGVLVRAMRRWKLNRTVDRQHLLRGIYELLESQGSSKAVSDTTPRGIPVSELLALRSWSPYRLMRQIERCRRAGLLVRNDDVSLSLTAAGLAEAQRLVHEHRLWELYLITHADVAPGRVDQSADAIEHVLEPELIARLEKLLQQVPGLQGVAPSPHPIDQPGGS